MQTRLAIVHEGAECGNHPRDYWYIVANSFECRPHLKINPKELDTRYFYQNGKLSKFNIILAEQLNVSQTPSLAVLKELLAANGSLIFYGWRPSWEELYEQELDIQQVFFFSNKLILFTGEAPIANVIEVINIQLNKSYMSATALSELNYIYTTYAKLRASRPQYPPLLLCVLAHIEMYVELRKSREFSVGAVPISSLPGYSFFREIFAKDQDTEFTRLKTDMENKIESYLKGDEMLDQLRNFIRLSIEQFDTSCIPETQKAHTCIRTVLENILEILSYYDKNTKKIKSKGLKL